MTSLSPENQPSSLPPDLTTLVLILFDVGGVDSMIAKKEAKKSHTKRARDVARDGSIDCSCETTPALEFKQKLNHTAFN